jgi:hypothetical protein
MRLAHFVAAAAILVFMQAAGLAGEAPPPPNMQKTNQQGLGFLTREAGGWIKKRDCVSCHHPTMGIWALHEAKRRGHLIDEKAFADMTSWAVATYKKRNSDPGPDTRPGKFNATLEGIYLGVALGAAPAIKDTDREVMEHLVGRVIAMQEADGSWSPPGYWPPMIDKKPLNTSWALLAISSPGLSEKTQKAAAANREKAFKYLAGTPALDHHQSLIIRLLLLHRFAKPQKDHEPLLCDLLARQNNDGGWSQTPDMKSDAFATGQSLYVLGQAGNKASAAAVSKAHAILEKNQRPDGSWTMTSRPTDKGRTTKDLEPITYAATAWATLGIIRSSAEVGSAKPRPIK